MNKKLIILIAAIVIIAGGAAAYFLLGDKKDDKTAANGQNQSSNATNDEAMSFTDSTIGKLLGAGVARKCTYSDQSSSGTIYLTNNNRMRVDYTSTDPDEGNGGMIMTSNRQYIWDADSKEGITLAYDPAAAEGNTSDESDSDQGVDMDQEYNFSCSVWIVSESMLTPPADINFVDMEAMMQQYMQ